MFCTNCGAQFEGNFCPNCGTPAMKPSAPARPAAARYPDPPLGTYEGLCTVTVKQDSIIFKKSRALHIPVQEIPYSDIAYVHLFQKSPDAVFLCLRTKDTLSLPFPDGSSDIDCMKDPLCAEISSKNKGAADRIYRFLKEVAERNAYEIPDPILPPGADFGQRSLSPKERIRENQRNGVACCPKCGSTSLSANKKGFGVGKAAAGRFLLSSWYGLAAGGIGSNKVIVTCLSCGHKWKL